MHVKVSNNPNKLIITNLLCEKDKNISNSMTNIFFRIKKGSLHYNSKQDNISEAIMNLPSGFSFYIYILLFINIHQNNMLISLIKIMKKKKLKGMRILIVHTFTRHCGS
jgi:hypothetical protein